MIMKYEYIKDLTSDVAFNAYGSTMKELFLNSAEALVNIVCDIKKVKPEKRIEVEVKGDSYDDLLFNWLQEIIALIDTEEMFYSKFVIEELAENRLIGEIYGESTKPELGKTLVKALTNHKFSITDQKGKKKATVTLDI